MGSEYLDLKANAESIVDTAADVDRLHAALGGAELRRSRKQLEAVADMIATAEKILVLERHRLEVMGAIALAGQEPQGTA